jgi:hypothetical protein
MCVCVCACVCTVYVRVCGSSTHLYPHAPLCRSHTHIRFCQVWNSPPLPAQRERGAGDLCAQSLGMHGTHTQPSHATPMLRSPSHTPHAMHAHACTCAPHNSLISIRPRTNVAGHTLQSYSMHPCTCSSSRAAALSAPENAGELLNGF